MSVVTSLPSSPTDGQECVLDPSGWTIVGTAEVVSDVQWLLRYRSSTGKWHLIGGDPLIVKVDTAESKTSGTTYANLPTAGPAIRVGVVGDYLVECGCFAASLAAIDGWMSYDIGTSGVGNAADTDGVRTLNNSLGQLALRSTPRRQTISTANHYFYAKYKWANGAIVFSNRFIRILPIRLG